MKRHGWALALVIVAAPFAMAACEAPAPAPEVEEPGLDTEACSCGKGQTCCGNRCLNLLTDPDNCGACGNRCSSGVCTSGCCVGTITAGTCTYQTGTLDGAMALPASGTSVGLTSGNGPFSTACSNHEVVKMTGTESWTKVTASRDFVAQTPCECSAYDLELEVEAERNNVQCSQCQQAPSCCVQGIPNYPMYTASKHGTHTYNALTKLCHYEASINLLDAPNGFTGLASSGNHTGQIRAQLQSRTTQALLPSVNIRIDNDPAGPYPGNYLCCQFAGCCP